MTYMYMYVIYYKLLYVLKYNENSDNIYKKG